MQGLGDGLSGITVGSQGVSYARRRCLWPLKRSVGARADLPGVWQPGRREVEKACLCFEDAQGRPPTCRSEPGNTAAPGGGWGTASSNRERELSAHAPPDSGEEGEETRGLWIIYLVHTCHLNTLRAGGQETPQVGSSPPHPLPGMNGLADRQAERAFLAGTVYWAPFLRVPDASQLPRGSCAGIRSSSARPGGFGLCSQYANGQRHMSPTQELQRTDSVLFTPHRGGW